MKTKISTLSIAIASAAMSFTGLLAANTNTLQVGTGYRQDSLTSTISQRGSLNPRAKSHLHFRDIEIVLIGVKGKTTFDCCSNSYIRADFDYGWALDGKLRESVTFKNRTSNVQFDRGGQVEQGEFLYVLLHNDLKKTSFVWDLDIAYVFPFNNCGCEGLEIGPGIGFSVNRQHLRVKNHLSLQDADLSDSITGLFFPDGVDSSSSSGRHHHGNRHRTSWWGPWIGFDFNYNSCDCWNLYGEFEVHIGRVRQDRDANVDNTFIDHRNSTKSFAGPSIKIGTNYAFCQNWFIDASVYYSKFFSFNSRNDLTWSTGNVRVDLGYTF
jgi:opacity protein-like surface antigen